MPDPGHPPPPEVALFVTCLVDLFRPSVGFHSIALLEEAGCEVYVPRDQTCCGQPGYNSGDRGSAVSMAQRTIEIFEDAQYVVAPSGSCAGMICHHYPKLLKGRWRQRARDLAARTYELTTFLSEVAPLRRAQTRRPPLPPVTYHDSCAGLRELGIRQQPRRLLQEQCRGVVIELEGTDVCCGFGGTFCAKMPEISAKMASDKLDAAEATGTGLLVGGDLGCLLNLAGRGRREGRLIRVRHVAELLVGDIDSPAIGEGEGA